MFDESRFRRYSSRQQKVFNFLTLNYQFQLLEKSKMSSHSFPLRGLMSTGRSQTFEGRFGRMFRALPVASYGKTDAETEANLKAHGISLSEGIT